MTTPNKIELFVVRDARNQVDTAIDSLQSDMAQRGDGRWARYINRLTDLYNDLVNEVKQIENILELPEEERG